MTLGQGTRRRLLALALGFLLLPLVLEGLLALGALLRPAGRAGAEGDEAVLVLCQGDSNVFGYSLDPELSFPAQLEALLRARGAEPARVVNRGVPGKPTWVVLDELEADLARWRPRVVVVLCGINDRDQVPPEADALGPLGRTRVVRFARRLVVRLREGGARSWAPAPPESNEITRESTTFLDDGTQRVHMRDREGEASPFSIRHGANDPATTRERIAGDLSRVAIAARDAGAVPIVCLYPLDDGPFLVVNEGIAEGARRVGAILIDPRASFLEAGLRLGRSDLLFPDNHPTALGYGILARHLVAALVAGGLVPGPAPDPLEELEGRAPTELVLTLLHEEKAEEGRPVTLLARHAPGHRVQLLLARAPGETRIRWRGAVVASEEGEKHHRVVPLARDELFERAWRAPERWSASFDAQGEARFDLRELLAADEEPVWVSAVVVAPGSRIVAVAEALRLR